MEKMAKLFEKSIIYVLIFLMMLVILLSTVEFTVLLVTDVINSGNYLPGIDNLLKIFGFFLLILIGVELLETIRAYLSEHVVHVEVVIEVALIAIARKVIILDLKETTPAALLGIAAVITALAVAYFLTMRQRSQKELSLPGGAGKGI